MNTTTKLTGIAFIDQAVIAAKLVSLIMEDITTPKESDGKPGEVMPIEAAK